MILQIFREPLKAGQEAAYKAIEDESARACAELRCPHPHMALETLEAPAEVWWLNVFASEDERLRVSERYQANRALMAVLVRNGQRKSEVTGKPRDTLTTYSAGLSGGSRLVLTGARFLVATVAPRDLPSRGAVFEAPDGRLFVLSTERTLDDARAVAAATGPQARMLAVQPSWGMPARDWIAADRAFWRPNPSAGIE